LAAWAGVSLRDLFVVNRLSLPTSMMRSVTSPDRPFDGVFAEDESTKE
jgi:hypothetical protein